MKHKKLIITMLLIALGIYIYLIRYDIYTSFEMRNCIAWEENKEVKIEDFKMSPNLNLKQNLYFWHGINLHSNGFGEAKAVAIFDKSKSWAKDSTKFDYKTELKFQKLLFDLTEVYARKINKKIKALKYANNSYGIDFNVLEKEFWIRIKNYKERRDEILNEKGKTIPEKIKYWRPKINEMLLKEE